MGGGEEREFTLGLHKSEMLIRHLHGDVIRQVDIEVKYPHGGGWNEIVLEAPGSKARRHLETLGPVRASSGPFGPCPKILEKTNSQSREQVIAQVLNSHTQMQTMPTTRRYKNNQICITKLFAENYKKANNQADIYSSNCSSIQSNLSNLH